MQNGVGTEDKCFVVERVHAKTMGGGGEDKHL